MKHRHASIRWALLGGSALLGLALSFVSAHAQDSARAVNDWSGFYGGLHVGGTGGIDSSLETQAKAEEQRTLAFCEKTPPGNPDNVGVLPNQTKDKCANDPGESPVNAVWQPASCPGGGSLIETGPNKDQCQTSEGTPAAYSNPSCSSGTFLTQGQHKYECETPTSTSAQVSYSCAQGATLSGTSCLSCATSGYKLTNGICTKNNSPNQSPTSTPATANYSCTTGTLSGTQCTTNNYSSASCPAGSQLLTTGQNAGKCEKPAIDPTYSAADPAHCDVDNVRNDSVPSAGACQALNRAGRPAENRQWRELAFVEQALAKNRVSDDGDIKFSGGIHGGYAFQRGRWVLGGEADINGISQGRDFLSSTSTASADADVAALNFINNYPGKPTFENPAVARDIPDFQAGTPTTITTAASGDFGVTKFGTVRGRLGMALGERWLPFITGGLAYGEVSTEGSVTYSGLLDNGLGGQAFNVTHSFGDRDWEIGWTAGGGVNYKVAKSVAIGFSYLYIDLGKHSIRDSFSKTVDWSGAVDPSYGDFSKVQGGVNGDVDATFHSARFDLTFFLN
jgi:opacity protein-like surface antigen